MKNDIPRPEFPAARETGDLGEGDFIARYLRPVFAVVYGLVQDIDDAQEITQEAFIKSLQGRKRPSAEALIALASREAVEFLREKRLPLMVASRADELSTSERLVLMLRDVAGVPLNDVAEALRIPVPRLRGILGRARVKESTAGQRHG